MIEKTDKQSNLTVFGKIYFTVIYLDLLLSFASMFVPSIPMTLLVHIMVGLGLGLVAYLALKVIFGLWGIKLHFFFKKDSKSFLSLLFG